MSGMPDPPAARGAALARERRADASAAAASRPAGRTSGARVAALLQDLGVRERLPGVLWRGGRGHVEATIKPANGSWLAPDIDALPVLDRVFLADDPFLAADGQLEANMVGSRGCYYDCSFCGAAVSANKDILVRTRSPTGILGEMEDLRQRYGVTTIRFVDDLFLAKPQFMKACLGFFNEQRVRDRFAWDATGRINVLHKASDDMYKLILDAGCREVALGIESGDAAMLAKIDKRITPDMTLKVVRRLVACGIGVKGYFILGFPGETAAQMRATEEHIHQLWTIADGSGGSFRASVFEFRPYPGTPEWHRIQFGEPSVAEVRAMLRRLTGEQDARKITVGRVQQLAGAAEPPSRRP